MRDAIIVILGPRVLRVIYSIMQDIRLVYEEGKKKLKLQNPGSVCMYLKSSLRILPPPNSGFEEKRKKTQPGEEPTARHDTSGTKIECHTRSKEISHPFQ